jgi:2-polyprenyl-3-methyl-5-hydroxy-6-metoxy-1,4-benzoquinol methylase
MKLSRSQIDQFWRKRAIIKDPRVSTHFKQDDAHLFDLKLIKQFCKPQSELLDVACGTCYLSNALINDVAYIKGTDKFAEFLQYCHTSEKLEVEQADILSYQDEKKYDIILMFGIMVPVILK